MKEHDVVTLKDVFKDIPPESVGTIVYVWDDGIYLVEFPGFRFSDEKTRLETLTDTQIKKYEI